MPTLTAAAQAEGSLSQRLKDQGWEEPLPEELLPVRVEDNDLAARFSGNSGCLRALPRSSQMLLVLWSLPGTC